MTNTAGANGTAPKKSSPNRIFNKYSGGQNGKPATRLEVFKNALRMTRQEPDGTIKEEIPMFRFEFQNLANNKQVSRIRLYINAQEALDIFEKLKDYRAPLMQDQQGKQFFYDAGPMGTSAARSRTGVCISRTLKIEPGKNSNWYYMSARQCDGREIRNGLIQPLVVNGQFQNPIYAGIGLTQQDCIRIYWAMLGAWIAWCTVGEESLDVVEYEDENQGGYGQPQAQSYGNPQRFFQGQPVTQNVQAVPQGYQQAPVYNQAPVQQPVAQPAQPQGYQQGQPMMQNQQVYNQAPAQPAPQQAPAMPYGEPIASPQQVSQQPAPQVTPDGQIVGAPVAQPQAVQPVEQSQEVSPSMGPVEEDTGVDPESYDVSNDDLPF